MQHTTAVDQVLLWCAATSTNIAAAGGIRAPHGAMVHLFARLTGIEHCRNVLGVGSVSVEAYLIELAYTDAGVAAEPDPFADYGGW